MSKPIDKPELKSNPPRGTAPTVHAKPAPPVSSTDDTGPYEGRFLSSTHTPIHLSDVSELKSQLCQRNKEGVTRIAAEMLHTLTKSLPRKRVFGKDAWDMDTAELREFDKVCGECMEECGHLDKVPVSADTAPSGAMDWTKIMALVQLVMELLSKWKS